MKNNQADDNHKTQEMVNPVFNTAKTTVYQMALAGDPLAASIAEVLGLTYDETQKSASSSMDQIYEQTFRIVLDIRYHTMQRLALQSGQPVTVDVPCGYTPRGMEYARSERSFTGLDLPAVISEINEKILPMIPQEARERVRYRAVDVTDPDSFRAALTDAGASLCMITEGLLMYLTDSEIDAFLNNIRWALEEYGGCWITADPEIEIQHKSIQKIIAAGYSRKEPENPSRVLREKADITSPHNFMLIRLEHVDEDIKAAMERLPVYNLRAERLIIADHMRTSEITSLQEVSEEQKEAILQAMRKCAFWKITALQDHRRDGADEIKTKKNGFSLSAVKRGKKLEMRVAGRLDTLTAPRLLEEFQKAAEAQEINEVQIDCSDLEYISSAGLRTLLIMHKKCKDGVVIANPKSSIVDIMEQTGFYPLFKGDGSSIAPETEPIVP